MRTKLTILLLVMTVDTGSAIAQSKRVLFGPGVCGPIDPVYIKNADETGGQPFPMARAEVGKSSRIMESSFLPQMVLWATGDRQTSYSIPIDSTVTRVMFSITFDTRGGTAALIAPDGTLVQQANGVEDTPLDCGRITTIETPAAGVWQLRVEPTGRFWVVVDAKSTLSVIDTAFVQRRGGRSSDLVEIEGQPVAGHLATLRVELSSELDGPRFQFVSMNGRPLATVDLQPVDDEGFVGTVDLPAEPFHVLVTARDPSGSRVQRIWPSLFHSESLEIVPPPNDTVVAGTETRLPFAIRNHGPAVRVRLVAHDERGNGIAIEPANLDLDAGAEAVATVRVAVPVDAKPLTRVSIRVTASADPAPAIGGFNSSSKTVTVVRK